MEQNAHGTIRLKFSWELTTGNKALGHQQQKKRNGGEPKMDGCVRGLKVLQTPTNQYLKLVEKRRQGILADKCQLKNPRQSQQSKS